jgi:hypothetical protein
LQLTIKSIHIMKSLRGLLFFTLLVFIIIPVKTDLAEAQRLGVGVTGGLTIRTHLNNFRYEAEDINIDFAPALSVGFNTGVIIRRPITESLRFQAEPSIIMLGAKYNDDFVLRGFEFESDSKTQLLYLQLPLLLQISTTPPERTVFGRQRSETTYHLTGGVYGGYLLDATFSGTNTGAPIGIQFQGAFSEDVKSQYKEYDGGVMLGGGLEHGSESKIGFEIRAFYSVIDSGNRPEWDFKPHNVGVTLGVYYIL